MLYLVIFGATEIIQPAQIRLDNDRLGTILQEGDLLQQMDAWNGKVLFVKLDVTQSPHEFRYYGYHATYLDVNQNQRQDESDLGFVSPASTIKVSVAALALEKLEEMRLSRQTQYRRTGSTWWFRIDEDIRRALIVSDNEATNRLILWLGFDWINSRFKAKGLSHLVINRLMLNRGVLPPSPAFDMRLGDQFVRQPAMPVSIAATCNEKGNRVGNCATAADLIGVLMRIIQPEYWPADKSFLLRQADRTWLQTLLSHTPRQEGFDYADDHCRFLTQLANSVAAQSGRMLSKCGNALFSNTYVDTSFIETDAGQKYYVAFSVTPPARTVRQDVLAWMNQVVNFALPRLR